MSSRADQIKRIQETAVSWMASEHELDKEDVFFDEPLASALLNVVMPLIVEPRQMLGVPEGSILIVLIQAGARALRWEDGHLHGNLRADQMPMTPDWVIERYGSLTVVWMP